jgi:hypothetical protein
MGRNAGWAAAAGLGRIDGLGFKGLGNFGRDSNKWNSNMNLNSSNQKIMHQHACHN